MKHRMKRAVVFCMAFLIAAAGLAGCSRDGEAVSGTAGKQGGDKKNTAMGRYVEQEVELPEGADYQSIMKAEKNAQGEVALFVKDTSKETLSLTKFILKEDNTWEKQDCAGFNEQGIKSAGFFGHVICGADNSDYLLYYNSRDENSLPVSHLIKSTDGKPAEEIKIPDFEEKTENGYVSSPTDILVLENGNIVTLEWENISLYSGETGERIKTQPAQEPAVAVAGNQIYLYSSVEKIVTVYDGVSGEKTRSVPLDLKKSYGAQLRVNKDGEAVMLSADGIQILKGGSELWETIVEPQLCTIGSAKYYFSNLVLGAQDDYYVFFISGNETCKLVRYVYDPNVTTKPEKVLTVFTLKENSAVRQAASDFQAKNPDTWVDIQVAMGEDGAAVSDDYIRSFNTELLAGNGPDLIVLDGLPEKSYIEKGVLADISDIINPLVSSKDLLPNVVDNYEADGKIYMMPTRIGLPTAFGTEELVKMAGDPAQILDYINRNPDKSVFGTLDQKAFASFYLNALKGQLLDAGGQLDAEKLKPLLEQLKAILDSGEIADGAQKNQASSDWDLLYEGNLLYLGVINGFYMSQYSVSVTVAEESLTFGPAGDAFVPYGKVGMNKSGKNQEASRQFMQELFTEEAQDADYYDGFPVNQKSLEKYLTIERSMGEAYGGSFQGANGKEYETKIDWPAKDQRRMLVSMCESVTKEALLDSRLESMVLDGAADYLNGNKSLDETIGIIRNKIKTYQTE